MSFFSFRQKTYPLIALFAGAVVLVFGLIGAKTVIASYFLIGVICWYLIFGYYKQVLRVLPAAVFFGGIFAGIAYAASHNPQSALAMANRFGALFLAAVPGMATAPVRMTRSLSQVHTPRSVTLGMLIAMSFVPMLKVEIKRVREAMKTRGAGSILNPKILYRAFLVPLVMRLVNISDTLTLSVETRGFALGKAPYSIYKRESVVLSDILFALGILGGALAAVIV